MQYPESFDPSVPANLAYSGKQLLTNPVDIIPGHKMTYVPRVLFCVRRDHPQSGPS